MGLMDFSLEDIGGVFTSIREAITGEKIKDPAEMAKIELKLQQLEQAARDGQISINKIEAAHKSIFVAGWRPFIGWTCGIGICYAFLLSPLITWGVKIAGLDIVPPEINTDTLYNLVIAMLGMAGLRTYEKTKNVSREK
jgi:hypothetical protein